MRISSPAGGDVYEVISGCAGAKVFRPPALCEGCLRTFLLTLPFTVCFGSQEHQAVCTPLCNDILLTSPAVSLERKPQGSQALSIESIIYDILID